MSASSTSERAFLAAEAMLAHLHPKDDSAEALRQLREHFCSADAMFRADPQMLEALGVRAGDALLLCRMPELARCLQRNGSERWPLLDNLRRASAYLVPLYHGLQVERFYLLCLDERGRLRERVLLQEGTSDGALFSLRRMLSEAIRTNANALVISHNHPGLTMRPSSEDIERTREAIRALTAVGIPLLDHIVVAGRSAVSLRENGFLPSACWLAQAPGHRLLCGWLDHSTAP